EAQNGSARRTARGGAPPVGREQLPRPPPHRLLNFVTIIGDHSRLSQRRPAFLSRIRHLRARCRVNCLIYRGTKSGRVAFLSETVVLGRVAIAGNGDQLVRTTPGISAMFRKVASVNAPVSGLVTSYTARNAASICSRRISRRT